MAQTVRMVTVITLVLAAMILSAGPHKAEGQGCKGDMAGLTAQCASYVGRGTPQTKPSEGCCGVIKQTDVDCLCKHLPPGAGSFLDMDKVAYVCKTCGNPLKPGTKCGSN